MVSRLSSQTIERELVEWPIRSKFDASLFWIILGFDEVGASVRVEDGVGPSSKRFLRSRGVPKEDRPGVDLGVK